MSEKPKFDWNKHASIRAPMSVVEQLDQFKLKNGYTSRPQAIIAAIERAEKVNKIDEIKTMLGEFIDNIDNRGDELVRNALLNLFIQKHQ